MLNANEIGQFIAQPQTIRAEHLEDLLQLTEKYPYAQLFSMLYLRGLSANNSVDFESALKRHSYRISDRAQLYRLIHDHEDIQTPPLSVVTEPIVETPIEQKPIEETPVEAITVVEAVVLEPEEIAVESVVQEIEPMEVKAEEVVSEAPSLEEVLPTNDAIDPVESTHEQSPAAEHTSTEVETEEDPTEEEQAMDAPSDPLEVTILHHAMANNYQLDALTPEEEQALEERVPTAIEPPTISLKLPENEDTTDSAEKEAESTKKMHLSIDTRQSFTGWLKSDTNYSEADSKDEASIHALVDGFSAFDPLESLYGEVEKPKKEFFSPTKKAKESLREDQLPVSETLAKIYIMQGNYPKAIAAYEELSLSFPEKKIFFANLIEDLQKKLNK